jgi:hypothetical protein
LKNQAKKVGELFPNFSVMVQGGVNFEPYKAKLTESIGRNIDTIELFPASEGFFAFQDSQKEPGMLLNTNSGIFSTSSSRWPRFTRKIQPGLH